MKSIRCIFMGTPEIAATVLKNMLDAGIHIDLVVTQPDKKVGRKQTLHYSEVKQVAVDANIEVFQPRRLKDDYQTIIDAKPDVIVTCAYGQLVPDVILDLPKYGCVNLHGSILPKYRGGAPIQRAIWNQETVSGMSLMKMVTALDAGPVLAVKEIQIQNDTSSTLFKKMADAASALIVENFDLVCSSQAKYIAQDEQEATYAPIIKKEEEHVDFTQTDLEIVAQIRALASKPGAFVRVKNKKLKLLDVSYMSKHIEQPFTILGWQDDAYAIALQEGVLLVKRCQMEGKPEMDAKSFYNGQGRNLVNEKLQ